MMKINNVNLLNNKNKLYEVDYMRVIACFAVMIVHITVTGVTEYVKGSFPNILMLFINRSFKFTTPAFIFLSGVTSFYSYNYKNDFKYFEFLKKRLSKVIPAYLVWCVIYYAAYLRMGYYVMDIKSFVTQVLLGTMSYHLYFVIIIVQMYILGPIFYFSLKNSKNKIGILIATGIITYLSVEFIRFYLSDRLFIKYLIFFMLGIYVSVEYDKYRTWVTDNKKYIFLADIIMSIVYTCVSYYDLKISMFVWFVFVLVSIFSVYNISLILKEKFGNIYGFIKLFGQSSYYIYLMHPLILTIMIRYAERNFLSVTNKILLFTFTVIPITVISCIVFTLLKNKLKEIQKKSLAANN